MPKIIVVGGYGHYDHGDDAQAWPVTPRLHKAVPDAEISVAINHSYDHAEIPECTRNPLVYLLVGLLAPQKSRWVGLIYRALGVFGILFQRVLQRVSVWHLLAQGWLCARTGLLCTFDKSVRQVLEIVRSGDLLYISGGGNWNDLWLLEGLIARMILVRLFHYFGKPVVISGQGVGPLQNRYGRRFLKRSLRYADMVTLRDFEGSERLLREIGVRGPIIMSVGDDSLGLEPASKERAEEVIREAGLDPSDPIMGVQVRLTTWHRKEVMEYARSIAAILDTMAEIFGVKILFMATEFKPAGGWDDRDHAYHVRRYMHHWKEAVVIHSEVSPAVGKALPGCCQMLLATAYHPCVFALEAGVPTVSICGGDYHTARAKGLFRFYDLDECAIEYSEVTPKRVENVMKKLLADRPGFIEHVKEVNSCMRSNIDITIQRCVELLKKTAGKNT